ncbi:MAG: hypothetical protein ACXVBV_17525, partial [Isosphaeraceae bacterium]
VEVRKITPEHFERHPVWTFQGSGNEDTPVRPMEGVPVAELGSSLVGDRSRSRAGNRSTPGAVPRSDPEKRWATNRD